jgi:hypothetical protein
MAYKAIVNFSGRVSMCVGEVKEIADAAIVKDLIKAGYIEEVKPADKAKPAKEVKEEVKKPAKKANPRKG